MRPEQFDEAIKDKTPTLKVEIKEFKPSDGKIDARQAGLKVFKSRTEQPTMQRFAFTPKILPQIKDLVEEVRWNSIKKSLTVIVQESPTFAAYRWFSGINERAENLRGLEDVDTDVVYLSFLDRCDREVARFKFKGITLIDHECLQKNKDEVAAVFGITQEPEFTVLAHALELRYTKVEQLDVVGPDDKVVKFPEELIDEEWQTLEVK